MPLIMIIRTTLSATLGALLGTTPLPASAEDVYTPPFALEKRGAAKNNNRYGELSVGAVSRGTSNPCVVKTRDVSPTFVFRRRRDE